MTVSELYEIIRLRVDVFVVEQNCPYHELDGADCRADHIFLTDDEGVLQAYLRVVDAGVLFPETAIGRVVVRTRRRGLGTRLLREGIARAKRRGARSIYLEAQCYARAFYEKAGFAAVTPPFDEDGIPHVGMRLVLAEGEK